MADWSQLPGELLQLIAKRLDKPFYQLSFRSVCSSWRSSFTPKPSRFPSLPNDVISVSALGFCISKRTIFLLSPSSSSSSSSSYSHSQKPPISSSWLVKIEPHFPNRIRLLDPLSRFQLKPLNFNFPKVINLNHFTLIELGHEYVIHYTDYRPFSSLCDWGNIFMEKVVFMCLDWESCDFALLTIHAFGKLAMFKSGDKEWSVIHEMPSPYVDVVLFRSEFYAVDITGRTVRVGLDLGVSLVAESVFGGEKKFLVESSGGLLLVDVYYEGERTVRLKVFELDEVEKRWVEVGSLGDRMLFLGDDCKFSVSTEGLVGCKGNRVFFKFSTDNSRDGDMGVFDLVNGNIETLASYPEYLKLFWPPPDWITSTASAVGNLARDELTTNIAKEVNQLRRGSRRAKMRPRHLEG